MWHLPGPNLCLPGSKLFLLSHQGSQWTFLFGVTIQPSIACLARYLPVSEDLLSVSLSSLLHTHTHPHTPTHTHTPDHKLHESRTPCWEQSGCSIHLSWWEDGWTGEPKKGMVPRGISHGNHLLQLLNVAMPLWWWRGRGRRGQLLMSLQGLRGATKDKERSLLFQSS